MQPMSFSWIVIAVACATGRAQQPEPEPAQGDPRLELSLVFERDGYVLGEPIVGWTVVRNVSDAAVEVWDPMRGLSRRRHNLDFAVTHRASGERRRNDHPAGCVAYTGPASGPPARPRKLPPGRSLCLAFVLDSWFPLRRTGTHDVAATLRVCCDWKPVSLTASASLDVRAGTPDALDRVVARLHRDLVARRSAHAPPGIDHAVDLGPPRDFVLRRIAAIDRPSATQILVDLAKTSDCSMLNHTAAHELARRSDPIAVRTLIEIVRDARAHRWNRIAAASALVGVSAPSTIRELAAEYAHPLEQVRFAVARALHGRDEPWAKATLQLMTADTCQNVRAWAISALTGQPPF